MMKYKLLAVSTDSGVNIGDYIQALAAAQFVPHYDGFIERELLRDYNEDKCRVIMNGWYQHDPTQWPPSPLIEPLFVAVHFNSTAIDTLTNNENVLYLKKHEPIGCRDIGTADILTKKGIDSYFSGCLTLTLGDKYRTNKKSNTVYFVDPYFITNWDLRTTIKSAIFLISHFKSIYKISQKHPEPKKGLRKMMILTCFYREYRKFFTEDTLINGIYICQQSSHWKKDFATNEERIKEAEKLIKKYAEAALVVTSRIHCALPCLGLHTPVIFIDNKQQSSASACRFGGLRELLTIMLWDTDHLSPEFKIQGLISATSNIPCNSTKWEKFANNLKDICHSWVSKESN